MIRIGRAVLIPHPDLVARGLHLHHAGLHVPELLAVRRLHRGGVQGAPTLTFGVRWLQLQGSAVCITSTLYKQHKKTHTALRRRRAIAAA